MGPQCGSAYVFDVSQNAGDHDADCDVDLWDFALLFSCVTGPDGGPLPPECLPADADADNDVDLLDFAAFQAVFPAAP